MTTIHVVDGRKIPVETRVQEILAQLAALLPDESLVLIAPHEPAKLLHKLHAELPNRLNWAPLEQGPEVWRWHFTGRTSEEARTVTEYLCWDHRRLEAILADTMALARSGDWKNAASRMSEYAVGLRHHADIEDRILFPAYDDATGNLPDGPVQLMYAEHHDVRFNLDVLQRAIEGQDIESTEESLATLLGVTEEHHAKEEEILFPGMDEALEPAELTQLVERLLVE